jgi:predicted MFS family arabinose efflux permease
MASWSTVTPQQLALIGLEPEHRAAVVAMNSTAVSLGGVLGSVSFALLVSHGLAAPSLPFAAALVLFAVFAGQLVLIRKEARV